MSEKKPDPIEPPAADGWPSLNQAHTDMLQEGFGWALPDDLEDLSVEANFVHFLKPMMFEGYVAKMGPKAFTVLMAIKCHTDSATGEAFPSRATISKVTGLGIKAIDNAIKQLVALGVLKKKTNTGRRVPTYKVVEPIPVKSGKRGVVAMAMKEYASKDFHISEIKEAITSALRSGSTDGLEGVTLNVNLNVQLVNVTQGDNSTFTNEGPKISVDVDNRSLSTGTGSALPPNTQRKIKSLRDLW